MEPTQPTQDHAPSLKEAYERFQPLFLHALSRVSQQGFNVAPSDALDVIHSFLIDSWPSVEEHFDPNKGKIETYVYRSFQRYARRFAAQHHRERNQFVDRDTLESLSDSAFSETVSEDIDLQRMEQSMSDLPECEREVLSTYLNTLSERQTAKVLDSTRYHVHQRLVRALARLAIDLDSPQREPLSPGWQITRCVLGHGLTLHQAAKEAGISESEARSQYQDTLRSLLARVRSMVTMHTSTPSMPTQTEPSVVDDIIKAIRADNPDTVRELLRGDSNRSSFLQEMDQSDDSVLDQIEGIDLNAENESLAVFYEELARIQISQSELQESDLAAFEAIGNSEEEKVSAAFDLIRDQNILESQTPRISWIFENEPTASDSHIAALKSRPACSCYSEEVNTLVTYGLTPLDVFYAADSISSVLWKMRKNGTIEENTGVTFSTLAAEEDTSALSVEPESIELRYVIGEIRARTGCENSGTAKRLLHWMLNMSRYTPYFFPDYEADVTAVEDRSIIQVNLKPSDKEFDSILDRWRPRVAVEAYNASA